MQLTESEIALEQYFLIENVFDRVYDTISSYVVSAEKSDNGRKVHFVKENATDIKFDH